MQDNVAIIILAAGESKRLGRPKQLECFNKKTLLQHSIDEANAVNVREVTVVLGSRYDDIKPQIFGHTITILHNQNWPKGMATSIVCGLSHVLKTRPEIDKIILMVCDQPYINTQHLLSLIEKQKETKLPIVASLYKGIFGTPALFDKAMFPSLLSIEGDMGAGKLIKQNNSLVTTVPFEKGEIDIDKEEDVDTLIVE